MFMIPKFLRYQVVCLVRDTPTYNTWSANQTSNRKDPRGIVTTPVTLRLQIDKSNVPILSRAALPFFIAHITNWRQKRYGPNTELPPCLVPKTVIWLLKPLIPVLDSSRTRFVEFVTWKKHDFSILILSGRICVCEYQCNFLPTTLQHLNGEQICHTKT